MLARVWHAAVAVLVGFGLVLQVVITVRAPATPPGHGVGAVAGAGVVTRFIRVLSFFTIQSNILVGLTSTQLAREPRPDGRFWRAVRLAGLIGIAVTGLVYSTVLARVHEPKGWDQVTSNTIFHYLVPILAVLGWLLFGPRPRIEVRTVLLAAGWPLAWLAYTLLHGAVSKWYPYPFLDVPSHGYRRVFGNILGVLVVFGVVAALFGVGDRKLPGDREPALP